MRYTYRYRSFFWPALLILAGVIALLVNVGAISTERLYQLFDLWPLILIVLGVELIIRRSLHGMAGDVAAALIVLLAVLGAVGYVAASPNPYGTHTIDSSSALGNLDQASLEISVGAANVTLKGTTDVGSDLYRAHIEYSGPKPEVDFNTSTGKVKISQPNTGWFQTRRKFTLTVLMSVAVPWSVMENTGASDDKIDFSQLHASNIKLNTGASQQDITLGPVSGTVPVEVNGGALTVHVHRPQGVPTSIDVSGGAVNLQADGHSYHAVGSARYSSDGFEVAVDRYRITVNGGACTVTLDSTGPLA